MLSRTGKFIAALLAAAAVLSNGAVCLAAEDEARSEGPVFTAEEQAYIDAAGPLRVGYVQDRVPISFTGENGEMAGVSRYIFDAIERISGLDFDYVPLPAGSVTYQYLMEQQLDLVTSVEYNRENQGARGILISEPYLSDRKVIVGREDFVFSRDASLSVAISSGSQTLEKVLHQTYPNFTLMDYDSIEDCFAAVDKGQADMLILNQYVAEYWLYKPSLEDLKVIPVLGMDDLLCFSAVVPFDENGEPLGDEGYTLISILNKAIAALPEDVTGSFTIQAVMENRYSYTPEDFLYRYRYAFITLACSAVLIAALLILLDRQRARSMAVQADVRAKNQFLSAMSHEIRTPLNGLIGLNYLMAHRRDEAQLDHYLEQSTTTAKYLLRLVSDLLDMSMLHNEDIRLDSAPVDMSMLLSTVETIVRGDMANKGLRFQVDADLPRPVLLGDGPRIQQVLLQLLDNAAKFTPAGGLVILTVRQRIEGDDVLTTAEVADTGRGMSPEFQKKIFDAFAREESAVSKGGQGVGLGLPICHWLAKLMGGQLVFTSKAGEGSVFTFSFPARPTVMPSSAPAETRRAPEPGRILVAEDNELNGEIMMELLEECGYQRDLAVDGRVALDMFTASPVGEYGVILMDLLMPELDGFEAAAAIRALDRPDAKTVRIVACSANCTPEDKRRAFAAGMDDFLAKPVEVDVLLEKLQG